MRIGGRTVRPVVRVRGFGVTGGGSGAWLRIFPEAVAMVESDGRERRVPVRDNFRFVLRGLAGAALLVVVAYRAMEVLR